VVDYDRRATRARRQAYQDWFASDFAWTHQLTIAYQRAVELPEMTRVLRTILQWYDRRALGRYYLRKMDQRVLAIAIPEMLGSKNPHWHVLMQFRDVWATYQTDLVGLQLCFADIAAKVDPRADLLLKEVGPRSRDRQVIVDYFLKRIWQEEDLDRIKFSREFWR